MLELPPASTPVQDDELSPASAGDRLLRLALASARVGSWEWDIRTNRVEISEWVEPIYGLGPGQLERSRDAFVARVHPADREQVLRTIDASLQGSSNHYEVEHRVLWPDGSVHWIEAKGHLYRDSAGRPLRMAGTVSDITRRKDAEQKLIASEAVLRQLITFTPAAVAMFDKELRYLHTSERWLTDYHLEGQDLIGKSHYEVFPDIPERWKEVHQRVLRGAIERCDEDPFLRADGSLEWLQWEVRPWRQADGEIAGVIMFTQVITARKRAELETVRLTRDLGERVNELHESEARFGSALQQSPIGMAIVATDGRWLEVNPAICSIVGYTREELLGTNFQALTHPDDLEVDLESAQRVLARELPSYQMEKRYIHRDGRVIWVQLNVSLVSNQDGTPRHFISQIQDISERRRVNEALRKAEAKFSSMFLAAPVAISISRIKDGLLFDVNREFVRLFGYTRDEVIGRTTVELGMWPNPELRKSYAALPLNPDGVPTVAEVALRAKSGAIIPLSNSVHALQLDGESYILSAFVDLTERKRAEAAIRASEARLRRVVASPILGIAFGGKDGKITDANDECLRIIGYTRAELAAGAVQLNRLMPPEFYDSNVQALEDVSATGISKPKEVELVRKDGERIPVLLGIAAIDDDRTHEVVFVFDLTERRTLERQLQHAQRMEAVGRLAAGLAHDFNNVLSAITMSSELLRAGLTPGHPGLEDVLEIRRAADRAIRLIRQLLAFSRQQVLEPRVLDLNDLVANLGTMLHRLVGVGVEIVTNFETTLGAVRADPGQLEQVIINLAVNGRDAMPNGGSLTIETANVSFEASQLPDPVAMVPGRYVVLSMSDTGTGMDAETKARLFEPFFTTKEQGKGTGLGLSTVYGIVRQSGGAIQVTTELGRGSSFRIFLPIVHAAVEIARESGIPQSIGGSETVLVVEDDAAVRQLTRKILAGLGYRVLDAANPAAAVETVKVYVGAIDLLLTDLVMPGGSGVALASELVRERPNLRVLYMSGYTDDLAIREGIMGPATAYIQKPFSTAALAHRLRALLEAG